MQYQRLFFTYCCIDFLSLFLSRNIISVLVFSYTVHCRSNPCIHGGVCKGIANGYTCTCKDNYIGSNCESEYVFSHVDILIICPYLKCNLSAYECVCLGMYVVTTPCHFLRISRRAIRLFILVVSSITLEIVAEPLLFDILYCTCCLHIKYVQT